jgi:hypothetical protein
MEAVMSDLNSHGYAASWSICGAERTCSSAKMLFALRRKFVVQKAVHLGSAFSAARE